MKIKVESILVDNLPVNKKTFDLAMFIYQGGEIPPIRLEKSSLGGYKIKDGRHRVCAYKLLGFTEIEAIILESKEKKFELMNDDLFELFAEITRPRIINDSCKPFPVIT
jgi:hypothetical protein